MGVLHIFNRFILILYSMFFGFILFANLSSFAGYNIFSGGFYDAVSNKNTFENSYFGFASLINAFGDFPGGSCLDFFRHAVNNLVGSLSGGVKRLSSVADGFYSGQFQAEDLLNLGTGIIEILISPFTIAISLLEVLLGVINLLVEFAIWFAKLSGGFYNIPLRTSV